MITRPLLFLCLLLTASCTLPEEKRVAEQTAALQDTSLRVADSNTARQDEPADPPLPLPPPLRKPEGIYQAVLPLSRPLTQTIVFNKDLTYLLQESYLVNGKDSTVQTRGNWNPSDGFIWLYKDQVVRARYLWKNDTLQYYSPLLKKSFSMQPVEEMQEPATAALVTGGGTEPFWSIEVVSADSMHFRLPEWEQPLGLQISGVQAGRDSTVYLAGNETESLRLTLLPLFCSDGMSDLVYPQRVKVVYNNRSFTGCGRIRKP